MVWTRRLAYRRPMTSRNEGPVIEVTTVRVERGAREESTLFTEGRQESRGQQTKGGYSWLEDYLVRLDGKEARGEYYAWLE